MSDQEGTIHHVSDTALWVAHFRAMESERSDALFRDPYAKLLSFFGCFSINRGASYFSA